MNFLKGYQPIATFAIKNSVTLSWVPQYITCIIFLQISNPLGAKPGLRFCTLPHSYSEATMRSHYPTIHKYIKKFNMYNVTQDAIAAVKDGYLSELEATVHTNSY